MLCGAIFKGNNYVGVISVQEARIWHVS